MVSFKYTWTDSQFNKPLNLNQLQNDQAKEKMEEIIQDFTKKSGINTPLWYWFLVLIVFISGIVLWAINIWAIKFKIYLLILSFFLCFISFFIPFFHTGCKATNIRCAEKYFEKNRERYNSELLPFNLGVFFNLRQSSMTRRIKNKDGYTNSTSYWISGDLEFRTLGEPTNQNLLDNNALVNPLFQQNTNNNNNNDNNMLKKLSNSLDNQNHKPNIFPLINNNNFLKNQQIIKNEENQQIIKNINHNPYSTDNNMFARVSQSDNPNYENNSKFDVKYPLSANYSNKNYDYHFCKPRIENQFMENAQKYQPNIDQPYCVDNDLKVE